MRPGDPVRILINAGLVDPEEKGVGLRLFVSIVPPGTLGRYVGPHPTLEGWSLVEVDGPVGRKLYAPLGPDHFVHEIVNPSSLPAAAENPANWQGADSGPCIHCGAYAGDHDPGCSLQ